MMPSFNKATHRQLARLIRKSADHCKAGLITLLEQQPRKVVKPMKKARLAKQKQKQLTKKEETARIREACMKRAGGYCEHCGVGGMQLNPLEMDHWLGGNGRRRQKQAVENCWMLHRTCHQARQRGSPSVAYWNGEFERHCKRYGYPFTPHIEHAPLLKSSTPSVPEADTPLPDKGIGGVDLKQLSEKEG